MSVNAAGPPHADGQLRRAAIMIYATLAINALCIPVSVADWVDQLEWEQARAVLMPVATCIVQISKFSGADRPYAAARELFLSMTGKKADNDS
jgi:hypothetical protein